MGSPTPRGSFGNPQEVRMSLEEARKLFSEGRRRLYDPAEPGDLERGRELLEEAREALKGEAGHGGAVLVAEVEYELGNSWYEADKGKAERHFEAALKAAEKALELGESPEAHCLLGEALSRLIEFRGWGFAISAGPRSRKAFERALELDPDSARAHLDLGLSYLFTPKMFGGSIAKALEHLGKSLELARDDHTRFLSHIWLAQAHAKAGNREEASLHLRKALDIYPHNRWAGKLLQELG